MAVCATALFAGLTASASAKSLGQWTSADVDAGVTAGVNHLDSVADKTNPLMIHWDASGQSGDVTETGFAIAAIGAASSLNPNDVPPGVLADAKNAVQWLIAQQDTSANPTAGSWGVSSGSSGSNYATSIALLALSFFNSEPGAANAIAKGRSFEIMWQNAPPATTGNAGSNCNPPSGGFYGNCGSWTYNPTSASGGDGSNTGFGVTGLDFSGGVPAATAQANLGWARAIQELSSNSFATLNDGGGSYEPGETFAPFRSSANGSGTNLFEFAYDGVPGNDAGVQASIKFNTDVLDTYELSKSATPRQAIYHQSSSGNEDGACQVGQAGCDWFVTGDGGYHYSLFAISKGIGSYIAPNIADATNFYAKIVDLLMSEQGSDGSFPADLRDDGSAVGATSFAILALTKAGEKANVPPAAQPQPTPAPAPAVVSSKAPGAPTLHVAGARAGCAAAHTAIRVRLTAPGGVRSVTIALGSKVIRRTTRTSFTLHIPRGMLRVGHNVLKIVVTDAQGRHVTRRVPLTRCQVRVAPHFTG